MHELIRLQARMPDAVPDELRDDHPHVIQELGRDIEGFEGSTYVSERLGTGPDMHVQSPFQGCLSGCAVRSHHPGLPGRGPIHTRMPSILELALSVRCLRT
jgi:hypothetical protein